MNSGKFTAESQRREDNLQYLWFVGENTCHIHDGSDHPVVGVFTDHSHRSPSSGKFTAESQRREDTLQYLWFVGEPTYYIHLVAITPWSAFSPTTHTPYPK